MTGRAPSEYGPPPAVGCGGAVAGFFLGGASFPALAISRVAAGAILRFASATAIANGLYSRLIQNETLKNITIGFFRAKDVVAGGTAAAIAKQVATGVMVGGRDHILKGNEFVSGLERVLGDPRLSTFDRAWGEGLLRLLRRVLP